VDTGRHGPVAQGFHDGFGQRGFATTACRLRDSGDDGQATRVGQRLVGERDGGGQTLEQGLPAAPEIVHLGVERHAPLLGLPQHGLELLCQPRGTGLISSRRGRPGLPVGVVVPRRLARRKRSASVELCALDGDLPAKSVEAPDELLPGAAALPQQLVETGQLREEEAVPARVMAGGGASAAVRLQRRRVISELFVLRPVFQSVFDYLAAAGSARPPLDSRREQTAQSEAVLMAPP
jgi:hypothetical protein